MSERLTVPHVDDMPWENFYRHLNKRHLPMTLPGSDKAPERPMPSWWIEDKETDAGLVTVAFHELLHRRGNQNHDHKAAS